MRRAWRRKRGRVLNGLRLVAVGMLAGIWRYRAFREQLRTDKGRAPAGRGIAWRL